MRSSCTLLRFLNKMPPFIKTSGFFFARSVKPKKAESPLWHSTAKSTEINEEPKKASIAQTKQSSMDSTVSEKKVDLKESFDFDDEEFTEKKPKTPKKKENISFENEKKTSENNLSKKNFQDLIKDFNDSKGTFNLLLYLRFLNNIVNAKKSSAQNSDIDIKESIYKGLNNLPEVKDCIIGLKMHLLELKNNQITNFISILSKIDYYDAEIISFLASRIINGEIALNSLAISYAIWSLAKFRIRDEKLLDVLGKSLINQKEKLSPKSQANIFWALSILDYKNEELTKMLEESIHKNALNFDSTSINLIFGAYSNNGIANYDVLDALSMQILTIAPTYTFRNIANWLYYCSTLNYSNMNCVDLLERVIIKKIRESELKSSEESLKKLEELEKGLLEQVRIQAKNKKISPEEVKNAEVDPVALNNLLDKLKVSEIAPQNANKHDSLTPFDASQILLSLCKMKIVKPGLFENLEAAFVKMMPIANPSSFSAFAFAHSSLCTELLIRFHEKKKQHLRRSLKNIKKYNQLFYEVMIPYIKLKLPEFKFEELYSILLSATKPLIKKRAICRELIDISIKGLPLLEARIGKMPQESLDKTIFQYFRVAVNFAYKNELKLNLESSFQKINVDIKKICDTYGYLIPQPENIEVRDEFGDEEEEKEVEEKNGESSNKDEIAKKEN